MATAKTPSRGASARTAAPARATKPAAPPPKAATKAAAKPAAAPKAAKPARKPAITAEQRANYVEVAAYYIAERRGFAPGDVVQDWIAAEAEIDRLIGEGRIG